MVKINALSIMLLLASCIAWAEGARPNLTRPGSTVAYRSARPMNQSASSAGDNSDEGRIVYIQMVRYKGTTPVHIEELLRSAERTFGKMPEVKTITAGRILTDSSESYDYALIMEFYSLGDLTAFEKSEVHRQWVKQNNVVPLIQNHLMVTIQPLSD